MHVSAPTPERATSTFWPDYRTLWRWHFYAGICCLPFVIVLSLSGSIYLFKPQVERWIDRPHDRVAAASPPGLPSRQVQAALASIPEGELGAYELAGADQPAGRVLIETRDGSLRTYVERGEPYRVLGQVREDQRFMRQIFRLHGELWLGEQGSHLVELAACWTIVLLLSGLLLWWPQPARLAGVVYPRWGQGSRILWRDLHAVTGVWVSCLALFLLASGLPWAKFWGGYFKQVRAWTGTAVTRQDWSTGGTRSGPPGGRADQPRMGGEHQHGGGPRAPRTGPRPRPVWTDFDRVVAVVEREQLAPPVAITPPSKPGGVWSAKSNAPNRPLRAELQINGSTGAITQRQTFADRHWVDRLVAYGIAAHEGQLFGWPNVVLALLTAWGLVLVCVSAGVLWWRRRDPGTLGAPARGRLPQRLWPLGLVLLLLSLWLPLFGISLGLVWLCEWSVLRRLPRVADWLGLARG